MSERDDVDAELRRAAAFRSALRAFLARSEEVSAGAGLTPQRYDLLLAITASPGSRSTVSELSGRLRLRQTAVTELVKRAADAGLVVRERSQTDRRVSHLRATNEGERRLMHAFVALREDRRTLARALEDVAALFHEVATDA